MFGNIRFVFHFPISRQGIDSMVRAGGLLMSESCDMLDFVTTAPDRPIKTALGFCSPSPYFFRKTLIFLSCSSFFRRVSSVLHPQLPVDHQDLAAQNCWSAHYFNWVVHDCKSVATLQQTHFQSKYFTISRTSRCVISIFYWIPWLNSSVVASLGTFFCRFILRRFIFPSIFDKPTGRDIV